MVTVQNYCEGVKDLIYLDNAATSPILPEVKQFIIDNLDVYGNPSSLYQKGYEAKEMLENARQTIAEYINANPEDIFFTSGSTESNMQALNCALPLGGIAISSMEHSSVQNNVYNKYHFIQTIKPDVYGIISANKLEKELADTVNTISVMYVNNEIGSIQPIKEITEIAHRKNCTMHSDMTQAFGHISIDIKDLGVDMASASGHKFGAPRGVGLLYCNTEKNISPSKLLRGGPQERGYRAGTENVLGAAAMALALKISVDNLEKNTKKIIKMRERIFYELVKFEDVRFNSPFANCIPGTINVSFKNLDGTEIQSMLDDRGIAISTGSACHSGIKKSSGTLVSIGVPKDYLHGAIRISLSHVNTMEEIDEFLINLKEVVTILRKY